MAQNYVFLHGGGQGSWVWDELIAAMHMQAPDGGGMLALDVPGCGAKRSRDTSGMSVTAIVEELLCDIDAAGLDRVVLVGHSQAGTILPLMAQARPQLFSRIVHMSCLAPTGTQTALNWRDEMAGDSVLTNGPPMGSRERYEMMFCNDMTTDETARFMTKLGQDVWPASSYELSGWEYGHLRAIPATYLLCLKDQALLPAWQEIFAERLKVDELIRIDAGHQLMNRHPHAVAEILCLLP